MTPVVDFTKQRILTSVRKDSRRVVHNSQVLIKKMQPEENKRKGEMYQRDDSPGKTRKVGQSSSKFVDTLVTQWCRRTGLQLSLADDDPLHVNTDTIDETEQTRNAQEQKLNILQKNLQEANEKIVSLSITLENDENVKAQITEKFNSTREMVDMINNYYNYTSESMAGFQEHVNNLKILYNDVILRQQSKLERQEKQLHEAKMRDIEQQQFIVQAKDNMLVQEQKIQELTKLCYDFERQIQGFDEKLSFEKSYLSSVHMEEKLKLIKEHEPVVMERDQLRESLSRMMEEKNKIAALLEEKESSIRKSQEQITSYVNEIKKLSLQNEELHKNYEVLERNKTKDIEDKSNEIQLIFQMLDKAKQKENSLVDDIARLEEQRQNLQRELSNTKSELTKVRNTIESIKGDENSTIEKLQKTIKGLEKEKESIRAQHSTKVKQMERSQKELQEKYENTLKEQFKLDKVIEQLKSDVEELNKQLTAAKSESETVGKADRFSELLGTPSFETRVEAYDTQEKSRQLTERKFFKLRDTPVRKYTNRKNKDFHT